MKQGIVRSQRLEMGSRTGPRAYQTSKVAPRPKIKKFLLREPVGEEAVRLEKIDVLPHPEKKPDGCVLQMWMIVSGLPNSILAVCEGGAEVAMISQRLFQQLDSQQELRPTKENVKGLVWPRSYTPWGMYPSSKNS